MEFYDVKGPRCDLKMGAKLVKKNLATMWLEPPTVGFMMISSTMALPFVAFPCHLLHEGNAHG
jgi:hypothetical protein